MFKEITDVNLLRKSGEEWGWTREIYNNCQAAFQALWTYYHDFQVRPLYMVMCFAPTTDIAVNGRELDLTKAEVLSQDYKMKEGNWDSAMEWLE